MTSRLESGPRPTTHRPVPRRSERVSSSKRRSRIVLILAFALAAPPAAAQESAESGDGARATVRLPPSCRSAGRSEERLAAIGPRGDLVLASGVRARLDGIRWPDRPEEAGPAAAWLAARVGRALALDWHGETDRWGRRAAHVLAADDPETPDLAAGLVGAGLAPVDAGEADALCRPGLLVVEAAARNAGRGIWAEPIPRSDEAARLAAAAGRFVVAEGRVRSVGERSAWTYLNFAAPGVESLTVTIARRTWRALAARGVGAAELRGRRVRARGVVEVRRGPTIEVTAPEVLEVLDAPVAGEGGRARRNPPRRGRGADAAEP